MKEVSDRGSEPDVKWLTLGNKISGSACDPNQTDPRVNFFAGKVAYARSESLAAFLAQ